MRRDRRTVVAPRHPDIRDDRRDFLVRQRLRERRHPVRTRILERARRIAAVQDHADRVDRRFHHDRMVARERRICRRLARAGFGVAGRAVVRVDLLALVEQRVAELLRRLVLHVLRRFSLLRDRLQVRRHRARILVAHVLQAVVHDVGHRAEHRALVRHAGLQQVRQLLHVPVAEAEFLVVRQRRRIPVLQRNQAAREGCRIHRAAHHVDRRVAHRAVAEAFDEVRAAVPFDRLRRIRLVFAFLEEQRAPADQQVAVVERELQFVRTARHRYRRDRTQVRVDRVRVGARDLRVAREREARVEQAAILRTAGVHRAVEVVRRPLADAVLVVRRDVRRVHRAERRRHRQAARERLAAAHGVARDTVADACEVFALLDQRGLVGRRGRDGSIAVQRVAGRPQNRHEGGSRDDRDGRECKQGLAFHCVCLPCLIAVRCRRRAESSSNAPGPARGWRAPVARRAMRSRP